MPTLKEHLITVNTSDDLAKVRRLSRSLAVEAGFSLLDQTKLVTATSELARNMVVFAGGGQVRIELIGESNRTIIRETFEDHGSGIVDLDLAMKDGYSTGDGLGLGLSGSKRLVHRFRIESKPAEGTKVVIEMVK